MTSGRPAVARPILKRRSDRAIAKMKPRIGVLTSGGDCPGLNAVLRGVMLAAEKLGWEVVGFRDGFEGLLPPGNHGTWRHDYRHDKSRPFCCQGWRRQPHRCACKHHCRRQENTA